MPQPYLRRVLTSALTALGVSFLPGAAFAQAQAVPNDLVYIGSQGQQIRAAHFDTITGKLTAVGVVAEGLRPTWTVAHPQLPMLYAVDDERTKEGSVTAFAINRSSGALTKVNSAATGGEGSTYLSLDAPSHTLLAANFSSGSVASVAVKADGSLGERVSLVKASGFGPHRRQASAHAHSIALDPSGRYAIVADLGADRLFAYPFDRASKLLSPDDPARPRALALPAGSGPRHFAFGSDGRFVYLLTELSAEIVTLRWDAPQGRLSPVQTLSMSSPDFKEARSGSEIAVSGDGRFVYAGNRAEHQLMVYRVDAASGQLTLVQRVSSGGELPWNFTLHPSGQWMLVANQRSNRIAVFSVDRATGMLAASGQFMDAPTPVNLTFVK